MNSLRLTWRTVASGRVFPSVAGRPVCSLYYVICDAPVVPDLFATSGASTFSSRHFKAQHQGRSWSSTMGGRLDEACVGDLVALEAKAAGIAGIVIWGLHRDSRELSEIDFPIFSLGALPTGPQRLNARPADILAWATIGAHVVSPSNFVVADANGVLFLPEDRIDEIIAAAVICRETEARQLKAMMAGLNYRSQVRFDEYMFRRGQDTNYGFRQHLKEIKAAGEV